ncbi:DUF456 domain-containing protein [Natronolimnohabitans sp. A-GB9]|uniref:DUF456 domain-containing protein n=1 Tax=Natronolimnohabitans sp. A-GB9 TaxID=3069757 RepID=UPI0027B6D99C|nr:DUF456 domain-containing protein [Natronolimnohabitans sp. A-GB9]MDQ2050108.1 DUF456 domain-containing protein [Natronolimnohabitans sp. A-GB9]
MSDRSDEVTESRDTEDLLSETEDLLSESGVGTDSSSPSTARDVDDRRDTAVDDSSERGSWWSADEPDDVVASEPSSEPSSETSSRSRSRLGGLTSRLSPQRYFSPRLFFVFLLLIGAGLLAGGTVLPIAGRTIGMFGVAFAVGLVASNRHYLEMGVAGASVGAISALAGHAMLAVAGSFQAVIAVGVATGLVGCVLGYYFGRDLRNGLFQDVESV